MSSKGAIALAVAIAHLLTIVFFMRAQTALQNTSTEYRSVAVMIDAPRTAVIGVEPPKHSRRIYTENKQPRVIDEPYQKEPATETLNSPTIDWNDAAAKVAIDIVKQSLKEPYRSLNSKPKTIDSPVTRDAGHKRGDSQKFEDGEIVTWINSRCYYSRRHLSTILADDHRLNLICK